MKRASDDMFIPVMPRILDPSLKFTEESILTSLEKSTSNFQKSRDKSVDSQVNINVKDLSPGAEQTSKKSFITIISKYKSYIFIILGLVVLVALLYLLYTKKFKKSKEEVKETTPPVSSPEPVKAEDEKVEKISSYLSNYIDTVSECSENSDTKESNIEVEDIESMVPPNLVPIEEEDYELSTEYEPSVEGGEEEMAEEKITLLEEETDGMDVVDGIDEPPTEEDEDYGVDELLMEAEDPVDIFKKYTQSS